MAEPKVNIPPLPEGFTLESELPPLPEGFTLESSPTLPEGFEEEKEEVGIGEGIINRVLGFDFFNPQSEAQVAQERFAAQDPLFGTTGVLGGPARGVGVPADITGAAIAQRRGDDRSIGQILTDDAIPEAFKVDEFEDDPVGASFQPVFLGGISPGAIEPQKRIRQTAQQKADMANMTLNIVADPLNIPAGKLLSTLRKTGEVKAFTKLISAGKADEAKKLATEAALEVKKAEPAGIVTDDVVDTDFIADDRLRQSPQGRDLLREELKSQELTSRLKRLDEQVQTAAGSKVLFADEFGNTTKTVKPDIDRVPVRQKREVTVAPKALTREELTRELHPANNAKVKEDLSAPTVKPKTSPKQGGFDIAGDTKASVKDFVVTYFKSGGHKPQHLTDALRGAEAATAKRFRDIKKLENGLNRLIRGSSGRKKGYDLDNPDGLQRMDDYLKRDSDGADLPEDVRIHLDKMRIAIDNLSDDFIKSGIPGEKLALTVESNKGKYVFRAYERNIRGDKFKPTEQVRERAFQMFRQNLPAEMVGDLPNMGFARRRAKAAGAGYDDIHTIANSTPEALHKAVDTKKYTLDAARADIVEAQRLVDNSDLDALAHGRVQEILDRGSAEGRAFRNIFPPGRVNTTILRKRKKIEKVVRDLMGEIRDPFTNFHLTTTRVAQAVETRKALDAVADFNRGLPDGDEAKYFYERPFNDNSVKISSEGNKALEPLDGMYTTKEIARELKGYFDDAGLGKLLKFGVTINSLAKTTKTVFSPITVSRNFVGNIGFAVANGHWRVGQLGEAIGLVRRDLSSKLRKNPKAFAGDRGEMWQKLNDVGITDREELFNKATELGVVSDNVFSGETLDLLNQMNRALDQGTLFNSRALSLFNKVTEGAADIYSAMDDVWKLYGWFNEISAGRSLEDAAKLVTDIYPTYSKLPRFANELRRVPLVGTFFSFPAEVVRVGKNMTKLAVNDAKQGNFRRLFGLSSATALTIGGPALVMQHANGLRDDELVALNDFVAPWEQNSQLLILERKGDEISFIDIGYIDPWSVISDRMRQVQVGIRNGEDPAKLWATVAADFLDPFIGEGLVAERVYDVLRNTKDSSGKPVFNPEDTLERKSQAIMKHVGESLVPPLTPGLGTQWQRLEKALAKEVDDYGRREKLSQEAISTLTGVRVRTVNVKQSLFFEMSRLVGRRRNAAGIFNRELFRETSSVESTKSALKQSRDSDRKIFEEFQRKARSARVLGVSEEVIFEQARKAGMSKEDAVLWLNGIYEPKQLSRQKIEKGFEKFGADFLEISN